MHCFVKGAIAAVAGFVLVSAARAEDVDAKILGAVLSKATVSDLLNLSELTAEAESSQEPKQKATAQPRGQREPVKPTGPAVGYVPTRTETRRHRPRSLSRADRLYRDALDLQASAPQAAVQVLDDLLTLNPRHTQARLLLGRLLTMSADARRAMHVLGPLLDNNNPDWQPWFWTGTALLQTGQWHQAGQMLDQALIRERQVPAIWVQRAIVEQERGDSESALQLLNAAARLAPNDPSVMLNIAIAASKLPSMHATSEAYYAKYAALKQQAVTAQLQ